MALPLSANIAATLSTRGLGRLRLLLGVLSLAASGADSARTPIFDVVVYGGTSAGVIAAVQAGQMGKSTVLIEPSGHFGGMTTGGLSLSDIGDPTTIGGLAREFYGYIYQYYNFAPARSLLSQPGARSRSQIVPPDEAHIQWTFEPHVAEAIFLAMLRGANVTLVTGERLNRQSGVALSRGRIGSVRMESGRTFAGRVFIDATYEGDLMAAAKVDYRVGREGVDEYGEALAGVFPDSPGASEVDPFIVPGVSSSGLLPGVDPIAPGQDGTGDNRVQMYNFRLCFTNVAANRAAIQQPDNYNPLLYELLARFLQENPAAPLDTGICKFGAIPGGKVDVNSNTYSTDMPGTASYQWPEASYQTRAALLKVYRNYTQGLFWFLANDPRVPAATRAEAAQWGPAKDEFVDNDNWPWQLYVREARRMVGAYVMTENNAEGAQAVPDPVALGSYGLDSHVVTLSTDGSGALTTEGYFFEGVNPYPISYRALTPRAAQCLNLLVPVCLSASNVAVSSIRMEPVYMMLGQAAATAAALAIDEGRSVQQVSYAALAARLQADGQILTWTAPAVGTLRKEASGAAFAKP